MKVLSVVCARAGSKGLKNKCVSMVNNKMVAEYAIEYSNSLGNDVMTVVSTDIGELIEYCRRNDIAYIKRDQSICTDESRIDDALADAIEKYGSHSKYCSLVYGNIPIRHQRLFFEALDFLEKNADYDAVLTMQNVEKFHPDWMFDYSVDSLPRSQEKHYRRQMLQQKMIHDGHTILFRSDSFYRRYKGLLPYEKVYMYAIYGSKIKPLINDEVIVDIDTRRDLDLAEAFICYNNEKIKK